MFFSTLSPDTQHALEALTGYHFNHPSLLWEALQANGSSVTLIDDRPVQQGNMRLALLGDAALKLALVSDWFPQGHRTETGSIMISSVGSNQNLIALARSFGLDAYINNNRSQGNIVSPRTMSAAMEAILGAVFIDSNQDLNAVKEVMARLGLGAPAGP